MQNLAKYHDGDLVKMKKKHPCGSQEWLIKRTGVDFTLVCQGCEHKMTMPRVKALKNIKSKI